MRLSLSVAFTEFGSAAIAAATPAWSPLLARPCRSDIVLRASKYYVYVVGYACLVRDTYATARPHTRSAYVGYGWGTYCCPAAFVAAAIRAEAEKQPRQTVGLAKLWRWIFAGGLACIVLALWPPPAPGSATWYSESALLSLELDPGVEEAPGSTPVSCLTTGATGSSSMSSS